MRRKTQFKSTEKTNDREEPGEEKQCVSLRVATHFTGEPQENDVKLLIYVFIIFTVLKIKLLEPCPCQPSAPGGHIPSSCSFFSSQILFFPVFFCSKNEQTRAETWSFLGSVFDLSMCHSL